MALNLKQKKKHIPITRSRRIADMSAAELRTLVESMIDRKLAKVNKTRPRPTTRQVTSQMKRRALSSTGRFHSGHIDIAIKHDDYLAASYRE